MDLPYRDEIGQAAGEWGVSPWLLAGLLIVESKLKAKAKNRKTGCLGVAQFCRSGRAAVTRLWRARGERETFTAAMALEPSSAIPAAAELLAHLTARCGGVYSALGAYGRGRCGGLMGFQLAVVRAANQLRAVAGLHPLPSPFARRLPVT